MHLSYLSDFLGLITFVGLELCCPTALVSVGCLIILILTWKTSELEQIIVWYLTSFLCWLLCTFLQYFITGDRTLRLKSRHKLIHLCFTVYNFFSSWNSLSAFNVQNFLYAYLFPLFPELILAIHQLRNSHREVITFKIYKNSYLKVFSSSLYTVTDTT